MGPKILLEKFFFFGSKSFVGPKKLLDPRFFGTQEPKILLGLNIFFIQNFLDLEFFADPKFRSGPKFFWTQIVFKTKLFGDPKFFPTQNKIQNENDL